MYFLLLSLLVLILVLYLLPTSAGNPQLANSPTSNPVTDQTGTVAVDWQSAPTSKIQCGATYNDILPVWCALNVTFKQEFEVRSDKPRVFATVRTRVTDETSSVYPVLTATVMGVSESYFTVLIDCFNEGGSMSATTAIR